MTLEEFKEELKPLVKGSSFSQLFQGLYYFHLFKMSTQAQVRAVNFPGAWKAVTKKKLQQLVNLNYLKSFENKERKELVFTSTNKNLQALKEWGFRGDLLPSSSEGQGAKESLYNTDVFVKAVRLPNFKALLFPHFEYLIPDGVLVLAEEKGYQLNFLEIEASKSSWDQWLIRKKQNYKKLARDEKVFNWWKKKAKLLNLPANKDTFKFQVLCIGNIEKDWEGWVFSNL